MANRFTIGSGLASSVAIWDGGASVPVSGDRVLICAGHTVTLDGTYEWGDDSTATIVVNSVSTNASITVQLGGTLEHSITTSSQLTTYGGMNVFGTYNAGTAANPIPQAYTATLIVGKQAVPANGARAARFWDGSTTSFVGYTKKRIARLTATANAAATSIAVSDATGWQAGDELLLAQTDLLGDRRTDTAVIAGGYVSGNLTVPLVSGLGFQHLSAANVCNLTSSVTARGFYSATTFVGFNFNCGPLGVVNQRDIAYATFENFRGAFDQKGVTFLPLNNSNGDNFGSTPWTMPFSRIESAAFLRRGTSTEGVLESRMRKVSTPMLFTNCVFSTANLTASGDLYLNDGWATFNNCFHTGRVIPSGVSPAVNFNDCDFNRITASQEAPLGVENNLSNLTYTRCRIYGRAQYSLIFAGNGTPASGILFDDCDIGSSMPLGTNDVNMPALSYVQTTGTNLQVVVKDCMMSDAKYLTSAGLFLDRIPFSESGQYQIINRNKDTARQELHRRNWSLYRDNSVFIRSLSSMEVRTAFAAKDCTRTQQISCANGATIRIIGYVRATTAFYNGGGSNWTAPTVSLTGLGATPVTFTTSASANNAWEKYDISITNSSGVDGQFTLTYTVNAKTVLGSVYFDGVPDSPFVTKCRHYGFTFDEANPVRVVNATTSASEATASGYTGFTVTWATSAVALTASRSFQYLYDYTQYQSCLNLASNVPLTGVGVAGSPSLFANGNVNTSGFTLNGAGSLSMGAYTLTANVPWAYTYTGGTFSQAATDPSFSGGVLTLSTAGTKTFNMTGGQITFSVAGTSDLSSCTLAGSVNLVNTSGGTVNITLAGGQSYTNTGPNISITAATINQGLSFTGLSNGSEVFIFNTGTQTVIASTTNVTGNAFLWSQVWAADVTVDYTIMKDGLVPIRVVGVLVQQAVSAVPVSQLTDRAYITPAGLTFGSTATVNTGTSRFTVTVATTVQNWYSFMVSNWRTQATLKNRAFPISSNGPSSFTLEGWEFSAGVNLLKQDGMRYTSAGVATMIYAAVYSVDTAAGLQINYQQVDGSGTTAAQNTGQIDQLIQVYGDAGHGNFDRRGFLALKVQKDGFDQAETDVVQTYGNLEDQLYIVGLNPTANGLATGAPTVAGSPTITDHGASPVTWNSKQFSITITDSAAGNLGTTLMRWIRYNLGLGGTFQSKDAFNWHDMVQTNGSGFKTVRGAIYGDTGAALKGVRVLTNGGASHPDFNLYTADDGTTYAPPQQVAINITGLVAGSQVQLYDTANSVQLYNGTVAGTSYTFSETYSVNRTVRLRIANVSGATAYDFVEASLGAINNSTPIYTINYAADQVLDTTYNDNGVDGSAVTGITFTDAATDLVNCNIAGGSVTWATIYAAFVYWNSTATGIANDFTYISAPDTANYILSGMKVKNTGGTPLSVISGYGYDATTRASVDIIDTTGGSIFLAPDHVVPFATGSGVTGGDITSIAAAVLSAASATPIASDIKKVNNVTINGNGVSPPFGP
jgi:hypothetical protein